MPLETINVNIIRGFAISETPDKGLKTISLQRAAF